MSRFLRGARRGRRASGLGLRFFKPGDEASQVGTKARRLVESSCGSREAAPAPTCTGDALNARLRSSFRSGDNSPTTRIASPQPSPRVVIQRTAATKDLRWLLRPLKCSENPKSSLLWHCPPPKPPELATPPATVQGGSLYGKRDIRAHVLIRCRIRRFRWPIRYRFEIGRDGVLVDPRCHRRAFSSTD